MIQEASNHAPRPHADAATRKNLAEKICHAYATGKYTIHSCCKTYKISFRQFSRWVENDPIVAELYNKARIKFHTENDSELRDIASSNLRKACEGFTYSKTVERTNYDSRGNYLGTTIEKITQQLPPNVQALKFVITRADKNKAAEEVARSTAEERTTMKTIVIMPVEKEEDFRSMSAEERKERDRQEQEAKDRMRREEKEKKEQETQARIAQAQSLDDELGRIEAELDPIRNTQDQQATPDQSSRPQYGSNVQQQPQVLSLFRDMMARGYDPDDEEDIMEDEEFEDDFKDEYDNEHEDDFENEPIRQMSQMSPPYINIMGHSTSPQSTEEKK